MRSFKLFILLTTFFTFNISAQSFENINIEHLSTVPNASRSANFVDVNSDGWDDIFISNGPSSGQNNMLFINDKNGNFLRITNDDIVNDGDRSDGASFADVDNDGDLDMVVVTFGGAGSGKRNYLYLNDGDSGFTFQSEDDISNNLTYSETITWLDYNKDNFLDAYVTNSVGDLRNHLYENNGDGSFSRVLDNNITSLSKASRSVDWIDINNDGLNDIFIGNEGPNTNSVFINDDSGYIQDTDILIAQDSKNSAGSSWADIDNDGDYDLFVANYSFNGQPNQLFINDNGNFIEDVDSEVAKQSTNSFGSAFADIDNDGDLDLFVCNAYLNAVNNNSLYINDGTGKFSKDIADEVFDFEGWSFGCGFGDYDNDGKLDLILANNKNDNQANTLYKNTSEDNNWVKFNLKGTASNASAIGAKLIITSQIDGKEVSQTRRLTASSGYCSQNSLVIHFGLHKSQKIERLQITWPNGGTEVFFDLEVNQKYTITENMGLTSVNEIGLTKHNISYFPNPCKDSFFITSNDQNAGVKRVIIFNEKGQQVKVIDSYETESLIDIKNLSSGKYLCNLIFDDRLMQSFVIIKS